MDARIRSINIENFRSIHSLTANISNFSVFVGKNDCGKSNILRALNLFFNGETNPATDFDFNEDYNFYAPIRSRRAKEIMVQVEIELPPSYRRINGDVIIWTKRWREDGLWGEENNYYGQKITTGKRGRENRENVDIPDKSNVHALLRKIDFEYVPAIKDSEYFNDLRGRIYGIISDVAAQTFHSSSSAFEQAIGDHLGELTSSISASLGFETRLALPRDLYHIFERLDFLSGEKSVSLNNRGDGIKARHIPLILKFMAEKKAELQRRGGQPISSIWAYEEPENNLEISSAVQLADEMHRLSRSGVSQIILTTHSPAFYDLGQRETDVSLNFVTRPTDVDGTVVKSDTTGIDESLGTLAMIAPRISEMVAEIRDQEAAKHEAAKLAEQNCSRVFVEGESDKIILERALSLFYPQAAGSVKFETKRDGAGHSYVIDMLIGWRSQHKHDPSRSRATGIVDGDAASAKNRFNEQPDNIKSAKCFCFPTPPHFREILGAGFKVPVTLETLYPMHVWQDALERRQLKRRDPVKVYPAELTSRIVRGQSQPGEGIRDEWVLFVEYDFDPQSKISTARRLAQGNDASCEETLANFKPLLREVLNFLGLSQE